MSVIETRTNRHLAELDTIAANLVWQEVHPEEEISDDEAMDTAEDSEENQPENHDQDSEMEISYPY